MVKVSASLMCADMLHFGNDIEKLENSGIDFYHIDIMDGHFVPNLSINFELIGELKKKTDKPLDAHLMVTNPEDYVEKLAKLGVTYFVFHIEAVNNPIRLCQMIRGLGMKCGVALNPATDESSIKYLIDYLDIILIMTVEPGFAGQKFIESIFPKIASVKRMCEGKNILIEVDGNINIENAKKSKELGANVMVLGTSVVFKQNADYQFETLRFKELVN